MFLQDESTLQMRPVNSSAQVRWSPLALLSQAWLLEIALSSWHLLTSRHIRLCHSGRFRNCFQRKASKCAPHCHWSTRQRYMLFTIVLASDLERAFSSIPELEESEWLLFRLHRMQVQRYVTAARSSWNEQYTD